MKKTLFIADKSFFSVIAGQFIQKSFFETELLFWERDEAHIKWLDYWEGDQIVSFKSDLILPKQILEKARVCAINFHPAPPKYRGLGGYNYALYNKDKSYGVTCHHMIEKIDFGKIIKTIYFPILANETVSSLKYRTGFFCLVLIREIVNQYLLKSVELPISEEKWGDNLYTLNELRKFIHSHKASNYSTNWLR